MSAFYKGYDDFVQLNGANLGANYGAGYVKNIAAEIEKLTKTMNNPSRKIDKTSIETLKGFTAEWWHEGTFNINAAAKGTGSRAAAIDNNGLVDIFLDSGKEYSVKYYKSGDSSAAQQAKTNYERYMEYCSQYRNRHNGEKPLLTPEDYMKDKYPDDPYYIGQGRLIPKDQLKDAEEWLKRKIAQESSGGRAEQVRRYQETLNNLTDRLKSSDGSESIPLTSKEAQELAQCAKDGGFDPAEWGLTTENLVKLDYLLDQAFKAGLSAALISVILKIAPEICGIIIKLIKTGDIEAKEFRDIGFAALGVSTEGFVRGTTAAAITISCKSGMLGNMMKSANANVIGVITVITMNSIQNACLMSFSKISKQEFANRCAQDLVVSICSLGGGFAGASFAASIFTPTAAILGYMVGSFVGSVVGTFVYKGVSSCVLTFCVESGSTFFGIVEQNYELPIELLKEIGVQVFEYEKLQPQLFEYKKLTPKIFEYKKLAPIEMRTIFLRRGVIKVGVVGYV